MSGEPGGEDPVRSAYDAVAADYARLIRGTDQEHPLDVAMIDAFLHEVGDGSVLDAGSGAGRISGYAASRGADIRGMDLSPAMVSEARRTFPGLGFEVGSLLNLPYADNSFAGILLWYSVIHLSDDELHRALAETARVTRPGGLVLMSSQAGAGQVDLREVYARMGHDLNLTRRRRSADVLAAALERAGAPELTRLVRRGALTREEDDHAVVLGRFM